MDWIGPPPCETEDCPISACVKDALNNACAADGTVKSLIANDLGGDISKFGMDEHIHTMLMAHKLSWLRGKEEMSFIKCMCDAFVLGMIVGRYEAAEETKCRKS